MGGDRRWRAREVAGGDGEERREEVLGEQAFPLDGRPRPQSCSVLPPRRVLSPIIALPPPPPSCIRQAHPGEQQPTGCPSW